MSGQFEQIVTRGTTEAAIERIALTISQGLFQPGDRLPSERVLAEQLGVSRHTVRKAVRALADAGVITIVSNHGAGSGARVLTTQVPIELLSGDHPQPNYGQVATVLEARRLFEPQVAVLAGIKMDDDDYEAMAEVIDLQKAASDLQGIRSLDIRFHLAIATATHNRVVISQMKSLLRQLDIARHVVTLDSETEARETIDIHERTLEAIASRDPARIARVMDEHLSMMEKAWERVSSRALPRHLHRLVPAFGAADE